MNTLRLVSISADSHPYTLQPLLWHHSVDPLTLKMDEEFLFGSHVLVASVVEKGATTRRLYLPGVTNDGETELQWCELDTGVWHHAGEGRFVELGAFLLFYTDWN